MNRIFGTYLNRYKFFFQGFFFPQALFLDYPISLLSASAFLLLFFSKVFFVRNQRFLATQKGFVFLEF